MTQEQIDNACYEAVIAECTCGGGGPEDAHTCPACKMWQRLMKVGVVKWRERLRQPQAKRRRFGRDCYASSSERR